MDAIEVLKELFDRIPPLATAAVDGLDGDQLVWRPDPAANTLAWLVWHAAREQDHQLADVSDTDQVWTAGGWSQRFGLDVPDAAMGYGDSPEDVARIRVDDPELLTGYAQAVHDAAIDYLEGLAPDALDTVVDENWDPPVTLGVRLISVLDDALQHLGQAAYLRGLVDRR